MNGRRGIYSMQSKKMSLIESVINVAVGYFVALLAQLIIFPILDIPVSIEKNIVIGLFFTVVSIVRSFTLRRIFNRIRQ